MNKSELMTLMAKRTRLPKVKCQQIMDEFQNVVLEACSKGDCVTLRKFGKFSMQERKSRKFLNPQTKRYYFSRAKKVIAFKSFQGALFQKSLVRGFLQKS